MMNKTTVKRLILAILLVALGIVIFRFIKRSIPYSDRHELQSADIAIDSIWSLGPATAIYDKASKKYYWLKSYTSFDQSALDTLKGKRARVRYMKFFQGPLENRVFFMAVDSVVVVDQIVVRE
ncbi:MAG: hypothetical protein ACOYXT_21320 [Bacteroidota bacterium]